MIRRFRDATVLLVVASNTYHVMNAACRLWPSGRVSRSSCFDADSLSALLKHE